MTANEFIFSNKLKYRLARHSAFWGIYFIYTVSNNLTAHTKIFSDFSFYRGAFYEALEFLPLYLFSVYFSVYFILPGYLAKRNSSFLIWCLILLTAITATLAYVISRIILEKSGWQWNQLDLITLAQRKCVGEQIIITGSAIIIKILKDYYLRQQENEMLSIENIRTKLQLLKMQMHPRILFESLQNIYDDIDEGTRYAPEMIIKLSDLLSYLLYEAELKQVALINEVKMIRNYIELKKLEYKHKIDIFFEVSGDINSYYIKPGLFLPLLEIGIVPFDKPAKPHSVTIELKTNGSSIYFNLKNNITGSQLMKMPYAHATFDNIKKRLQIFYLHKFKIEVHSSADSFTIMLRVEPDKIISLPDQNIKNDQGLIYEHT